METELKLLVNSKGALALRRHPLLKDYATSRMHEYKMSDTYFDTICKSGAAMRAFEYDG